MRDALGPLHASLEIWRRTEQYDGISATAGNLSEIYLNLGLLPDALHFGKEADGAAQIGKNQRDRIAQRTTYAEALHRIGNYEEALQLFEEAEGLQLDYGRPDDLLGSFWGYRFNDLLLTIKDASRVISRNELVLAGAKKRGAPLEIALAQLSIVRARYALAEIHSNLITEASEVVDSLTKLQSYIYLPIALLTRARCEFSRGNRKAARIDLSRASKMCEAQEMHLVLWECIFERARFAFLKGNSKAAMRTALTLRRRISGYRRLEDACDGLLQGNALY